MEETVAAEAHRSEARARSAIYWSVILWKSLYFFEPQFVIHNVTSVTLSTLQGCGEDVML